MREVVRVEGGENYRVLLSYSNENATRLLKRKVINCWTELLENYGLKTQIEMHKYFIIACTNSYTNKILFELVIAFKIDQYALVEKYVEYSLPFL